MGEDDEEVEMVVNPHLKLHLLPKYVIYNILEYMVSQQHFYCLHEYQLPLLLTSHSCSCRPPCHAGDIDSAYLILCLSILILSFSFETGTWRVVAHHPYYYGSLYS